MKTFNILSILLLLVACGGGEQIFNPPVSSDEILLMPESEKNQLIDVVSKINIPLANGKKLCDLKGNDDETFSETTLLSWSENEISQMDIWIDKFEKLKNSNMIPENNFLEEVYKQIEKHPFYTDKAFKEVLKDWTLDTKIFKNQKILKLIATYEGASNFPHDGVDCTEKIIMANDNGKVYEQFIELMKRIHQVKKNLVSSFSSGFDRFKNPLEESIVFLKFHIEKRLEFITAISDEVVSIEQLNEIEKAEIIKFRKNIKALVAYQNAVNKWFLNSEAGRSILKLDLKLANFEEKFSDPRTLGNKEIQSYKENILEMKVLTDVILKNLNSFSVSKELNLFRFHNLIEIGE